MFRASRRRSVVAFTRARGWHLVPQWEALEPRRLLSAQQYVVDMTADSLAPGTLRSAILAANQDTDPNPFDIVFEIPASTATDLNVPVPGFDPNNQIWQITLSSAPRGGDHSCGIDRRLFAGRTIQFPTGIPTSSSQRCKI